MGAFQNKSSVSIFRPGVTLTNVGGGRIREHKKCKTRRNGEQIHEFCISDGSTGCCLHGNDNNEWEFNTTKTEGGPNSVPIASTNGEGSG